MKCKKCGKELTEEAKFCPKCGYPTKQESQEQVDYTQYVEPDWISYEEENRDSSVKKNNIDFVLIGVLVGLIAVVLVLLIVFSVTFLGKKENQESKREVTTASTESETTEDAKTRKETKDTVESTKKQTEQASETTAVTTATTQEIQETLVGPIANPDWNIYEDPDYSFSIKYPSHFIVYNDEGTRNRYTLSAPDGTADLRIFSYEDSGLSPEELGREFETTWGGEREYFRTGEKYYAIRTSKDNVCYYEFGEKGVGRGITGFTLIYDKSYHSIYDDYVNIIYKSRSWKK